MDVSYRTAADARKAGWHSRRHETRESQDAARERYNDAHGRKARQRHAAQRLERSA